MSANDVVELKSWEIMIAAEAGIMRQVENMKLNRTPYYGSGDKNDWQLNIEGCLGEMALAKYLGVYWSGKGDFRQTDVGKYEVRTSSREDGDLILHPDDPDEKIFWLLCGKYGTYTICGWILGSAGKKLEYWKDPAGGRPAFFVPQSDLVQWTKESGKLE